VENLFDSHLSTWFKTRTAEDEWVLIPGPITASYFALLNHNLTSSAVIKIQGNDSNVWTSPSLDLTLTYADYIMIESFTEATYSYWRISLTDPDNPDGFIRLGGAYLGDFIQMPGMKIDQQINDETTTKSDYSTSRQLYADIGIDFKDFTVNFPYITKSQRDSIRTMWSTVGLHSPVIVLIWENYLTMQLPLYCHMVDSIKWKRNENFNFPWGTAIRFAEVF
jgi:hypothetical protein